MRLYLHIGTPKTGSTAIQNDFWLNRTLLLEQGLHLIEAFGAPNARGAFVFASSARYDRPAHADYRVASEVQRQEFRSRVVAALEQELARSSASSYFVSNEGLWTLGRRDVEMLREDLRQIFEEIKVVVYLRRQDRKAVSNYSTQLRNRNGRAEPLDLKREKPENYLRRVNVWSSAYEKANITVRVYERALAAHGTTSKDMLEVLGLAGVPLKPSAPRSNASISRTTQELTRILNVLHRGGEEVFGDPDFRRWVIGLSARATNGERPYMPLREEAEAFYAQARADNRKLARAYLAEEELFDEDFSSYPEVSTCGLSGPEFAEHALRILKQLFDGGFRQIR